MSVVLNTQTKFAKLAVGKQVVTSKQRHGSQEQLFPLIIGISGKVPLSKVEVDYEPQPKNTFTFRINDADILNLVKEEVDFDPSKTESLIVEFKVNDKEAINGSMPWIVDEVEDKIQTALGISHLNNICI